MNFNQNLMYMYMYVQLYFYLPVIFNNSARVALRSTGSLTYPAKAANDTIPYKEGGGVWKLQINIKGVVFGRS